MNDQVAVPAVSKTTAQVRDEYRAALVGNTPLAKSIIVLFHGLDMELREPPLDIILGKKVDGDIKNQTVTFIINYCFIPETDVKIFEEGDRPQILKWPFGKDFLAVQNAISELMGIDIKKEEEDLKDNPLAD